MKKQHIFWFFLPLLAFACEQPAPRDNKAEGFYDVSAYLKEQKAYLQQKQPMLLKSVQTGDNPEETVEIATTDWDDELAIFEEADLAKPSLRDSYNREEETLPNGNILVRYNKMKDVETPIQYLYLELSPDRKLQQLDAAFLEKNPLFYSKRRASLSVDQGTGNISGYEIQGIQKLIFGDSLSYYVRANL